MEYVLCWFNVRNEDWVGTRELPGVDTRMVREWFHLAADNPALDCYKVVGQADLVGPYFPDGRFDFGKYEYFVESEASFPGEIVDLDGRTMNEPSSAGSYTAFDTIVRFGRDRPNNPTPAE